MSQQMGPPRLCLALPLGTLLTVLAAVAASGAMMGLSSERKLLFMIAFMLTVVFEQGGDLLIVAWLAILFVSWNWPHLGRRPWLILGTSVAAIVTVVGTVAVARFGEIDFAEWWRVGAPLHIPVFFLVIGTGVGTAHAAAVARLVAMSQSKTAAPKGAAVRNHDGREA